MNPIQSKHIRTSGTRKSQRGVALWLIFAAIGLLAALAAALSSSSRSSSASTANDIQNTLASSILSQAAEIKQGLDHMVVNGTSQSTMTFTGANSTPAIAAVDLFGSGSAVLPTLPDKAFTSGTTSPWTFYAPGAAAGVAAGGSSSIGATITGVGNGKNWLAVAYGLTDVACAAIDSTIGGTAATVDTVTASLAVTPATSTALDLTGTGLTDKRASYCVKDSAGKYAFYSVLLEH